VIKRTSCIRGAGKEDDRKIQTIIIQRQEGEGGKAPCVNGGDGKRRRESTGPSCPEGQEVLSKATNDKKASGRRGVEQCRTSQSAAEGKVSAGVRKKESTIKQGPKTCSKRIRRRTKSLDGLFKGSAFFNWQREFRNRLDTFPKESKQ